MKEPYGEGIATHSGPESCGGPRKGASEALTGARAGRASSPEKSLSTRVPTLSFEGEGNTESTDSARRSSDPAWSKTPSTHGNSLRGNREVPWLTAENGCRGPCWESLGSNPTMHGHGKSDGFVVPEKPSNNGRASLLPAERAEGRRPAKGNSGQQTRVRTLCREALPHALARIRQAVSSDRPVTVTPLSTGPSVRQDLRQEPSAGNLHAGICAGGAG
jgi:RNA-directed DNA polymerase